MSRHIAEGKLIFLLLQLAADCAMTSPPNTQDMLACMNDALVQVAVYFEGKTKEVEVPCGGADGQLFLSELRDVVEDGGGGGASSSAAASSAAINFFSVGPQRLGVGNGELGKKTCIVKTSHLLKGKQYRLTLWSYVGFV